MVLAKKSGFELDDIISELKIENLDFVFFLIFVCPIISSPNF